METLKQQLQQRGVPRRYIEAIINTEAKDKNSFARGLFGNDRYQELHLQDFDLNLLKDDHESSLKHRPADKMQQTE